MTTDPGVDSESALAGAGTFLFADIGDDSSLTEAHGDDASGYCV